MRCFAKILHQLADLVVARAALQRLAQGLLGRAQVALGLGRVAVLDLQRHRPQELGDVEEVGVGARAVERGLRLPQAEIDRGRGVEQLRGDGEAGQRRLDPFGRMVRIEDDIAAFLDQRPGQRIVERPLRQGHFDRLAPARLARDAGCAQRHRHLGAGPGVLGEIEGGAGLARSGGGGRRLEAGLRRLSEAPRSLPRRIARQGEIGARARDPVAVFDPVGERQRSAEVAHRILGHRDRRNARRDHGESDVGGLGAPAPDRGAAVAADRPAPLDRSARSRLSLVLDRRDRALDLGLHDSRFAAHHEHGILIRRQGLWRARCDVDHQGRTPGVSGRIDPGVDPAPGRGERSVSAAPVEGGGEATVKLRAGRDRRGERHHRHPEPQGVGVALGHARRGRGDAQGLDRLSEPRLMGGPQGPSHRIVGVGERVGERGRRPVGGAGIPIEPRRDVAAGRPAQSQKRRERGQQPEPEQGDPRNAQGARGEEPGAEPGDAEEQDRHADRDDDRRPGPLDDERAGRGLRKSRQPAGGGSGGPVAIGFVRLRHARPDRLRKAKPSL